MANIRCFAVTVMMRLVPCLMCRAKKPAGKRKGKHCASAVSACRKAISRDEASCRKLSKLLQKQTRYHNSTQWSCCTQSESRPLQRLLLLHIHNSTAPMNSCRRSCTPVTLHAFLKPVAMHSLRQRSFCPTRTAAHECCKMLHSSEGKCTWPTQNACRQPYSCSV